MSSPTVDYFRKTSPSASGLSDEELTLQIYDLTRDDPIYDEDQEFLSQAKSLDTKRAFGTATRNIGRSLVGIPGGIAESVGIPLKQVSNLTGIPTGGESLINLGRGIRDIVDPPDPNDPTGFWRTDVASGLGSMTGFMAGGAVGKALKIPAMLTTGVLGAGVQGAQAYDDAIAHGASDGTAFTSWFLNLPVGASEMFPVAKMLDRFDKATAGTFSRTLFTAIKEGTEEGLQEFFQQPASNAIAKQLYDENREILDGAASGGAAGGILGFAASLIVSAAGGKVRAPVVAAPPPAQGSVPPIAPMPTAVPVAPTPTLDFSAQRNAADAAMGPPAGETFIQPGLSPEMGIQAARIPRAPIVQEDAVDPSTPVEPVSPEDLALIVQDYLGRLGQIPNPTEQQVNRLQMIEAILRNPTSASTQNLAALFNLRIDPSATALPQAFSFIERPMPSSAGGMLPGDTGLGMRAERRMMETPPDNALKNARRAASGVGIGPVVTEAPIPVAPPIIAPVATATEPVPLLTNLTDHEREVLERFLDRYEAVGFDAAFDELTPEDRAIVGKDRTPKTVTSTPAANPITLFRGVAEGVGIKQRADFGIHFAENPKLAALFGGINKTIKQVRAKIRNAIKVSDPGTVWDNDIVVDDVMSARPDIPENQETENARSGEFHDLEQWLKRHGIDALYYDDVAEASGKELGRAWILFDHTEIEPIGTVPIPPTSQALITLLRQEGLSPQQASDVLSGKITPEEAAETVIAEFTERVLTSSIPVVRGFGHDEAIAAALEGAIERIKDILASRSVAISPPGRTLIDSIDFQKARPVSITKGAEQKVDEKGKGHAETGTRTAPAYVSFAGIDFAGLAKTKQPARTEMRGERAVRIAEHTPYNEAVAELTDDDRGGRKIVFIQKPDGEVVAGSIEKHRGTLKAGAVRDAMVQTEKGKDRVRLSKLLADGWKVLGAAKRNVRSDGKVAVKGGKGATKRVSEGFVEKFTAEEWAPIGEELAARQRAISNFVESVALSEIGAVDKQTRELKEDAGLTVGEKPISAIGKLRLSQIQSIVTAIGEPVWNNKEEQTTQIAQAIYDAEGVSGTPQFDSLTGDQLLELIDNIADAYENAGGMAGIALARKIAAGQGISEKAGSEEVDTGPAEADEEGYESKFRAEPGLSTATVTTKLWNAVLDAIRLAGIPVRVFNSAIAKVQPEYRQYVNGDRLIIVGMNYQTGPTAGNLEDLLHEGGHALWAKLPQEIQDRLDRAVGSRSIMRGGSVVNESAEETIVDRTSQAMAREGFNPAEARGYAQQLWRLIKGLIQRLAMAAQEALFGRASQHMAEAYFKNQMESWLAGNPRPFSIIQFLGGGRPRPEHVADSLTSANGSGAIAALWDADNEQMVYPDVLIDGRDALAYTSKYRWQGDVSSPLPVVNETNAEADQMPFIATTNEISAALESAFNAWTARGQNRTSTGATLYQTFQEFFEKFLQPDNYQTFPGELVADVNAELAKVNKGPVQPDLRVTGIQEASARMRAATQALTILRNTAASLAARRADSQAEWNQNDNKIKRVARQINRTATHYTDVSELAADAKFDLEDIFTRFREDIRDAVKTSDKMGMLGQIIKQLVGDITSPVDTLQQFQGTLERLYRRISGNNTNAFVDMLDTVSKLNLPWDTLTVPQLRSMIEPQIQNNPTFAPLTTADDRSALIGILIAFGKQNSRVIDLLQLRALEKGKEREAINEMLKLAVQDSRDALARARSLLNRVSKNSLLAGRLLDRIEKMRASNLELVNRNRALDSFIEFHDQDLVPAMGATMRPMEEIIGAQNEAWEPNDRAKMWVPQSPTDTIEQVMDKSREQTLTLTSGQRLNADTEQQMKQMQAWLDEYDRTHPGEKGSTWNTVNLMLSKLKTVGIHTEIRPVKHNFVISMLGSLRDKLDVIGLVVTRELSKRLAWLDILHLQHSRDANVIGVKVDDAESAAMAEANRTVSVPFTTQTFRDILFQPAMKMAEDRKDISLVSANQAADETATLAAIRGLLLDNPASRKLLQANPKLWPALEQFYRVHWHRGVEGTFKVWNSMAKTVGNPLGATVQDEVLGLMRKHIGNPIHTSPRKLKPTMRLLWEKMRPAWVYGYATTPAELEKVAKAFADEHDADPALMATRLQGMFTPEVWKTLTRWIAYMPRSVFHGPIRADGTWPMARKTNIMAAYESANGDVLQFVEALSQLESQQPATSEFIGETLSTFQWFFNAYHGIYTKIVKAEATRVENPLHADGTDIDHFLMDSRKSEALPAESLEYATFGSYEMQRIFQRLAEHEAFGRDASAVFSLFESAGQEIAALTDKYNQAKSDADTQGTTKKQRDELLTQLLGGKQARSIAEKAALNLKTLSSAQNDFNNIIKSQATTMVEMKAMAELLGVSPAAAVQSIGTSFMDLISHFQPLRTFGLSSQGLQMVGDMSKASAARVFGSFFQIFGIQIGLQAEENAILREEGFSDPDEILTLREKVTSIVHSTQGRTDIGRLGKATIIGARTLKSMLSTGVPQIFKTDVQLYPTLKPAVFTYTSQVMQGGAIIGVWRGYTRMILKAVRFFRANPQALNDPKFRFTAADLGYRKGILLNDEFAFDSMREEFEKQGVGSLEGITRDAIRRQDAAPPGAKVPLMTRQQMQLIGFVGPNQILQDGSNSNRPTWMMTNPILKQMTTLLGWSMTNFKNVPLTFREPGGEFSYRALRKGLVAYSALIPIGIAFAMLRDEYDERVLGKKANVLGLGEGNNALAIIDMLDRAGTFGIGGNALNSLVNQDINREFSLDSRVFFASSLLNTGRAISNWVRQGEATWNTVYRPLVSGLGGSGFLQNADIINNAMSLDNAESRAVARISVNNYLRAVGRTLDLDVRLGRGQRVISNSVKPWVSEMLLAAYQNDMSGFAEAYRNAVTAAREAGNQDPADHVKRSYSGIHPLRVVYQTMPSEQEYRKILNALPANGREAVQEAIYRYNRFGERIGIKPSFGREEKAPTLNLPSIRSRAALAFSGF